jgi:hypothetical protein
MRFEDLRCVTTGKHRLVIRFQMIRDNYNARHHLLTADQYLTTQSFWALSLGPSSSSGNGCYGYDKGTEDTSS